MGVSITSSVPQARPVAGHVSAVASGTSHFSSRATSACHWSLPRTRSSAVAGVAVDRSARPPVRSDIVAVRTSADEIEHRPRTGSTMPAPVATSRGSTICRPAPEAVSFSISAPARVTCHPSSLMARAADPLRWPPSCQPAACQPPGSAPSRACQRPRSPATVTSADTPSDCGAGCKIRAAAPDDRDGQSAARFTRAPPVCVSSSESSPDRTTPRQASTTAAPATRLPLPVASSTISSSRHGVRFGSTQANCARLAESRAVDAPGCPVASRSSRPRALPASVIPATSTTSATSITSFSRSAVHWMASASALPDAESSTALDVIFASSISNVASGAARLRPRNHAANG